jgi:hypothetical protein
VSDTGKSLEFALAAGVFPGRQDPGAAAIGDAGGHDEILPGGPSWPRRGDLADTTI